MVDIREVKANLSLEAILIQISRDQNLITTHIFIMGLLHIIHQALVMVHNQLKVEDTIQLHQVIKDLTQQTRQAVTSMQVHQQIRTLH